MFSGGIEREQWHEMVEDCRYLRRSDRYEIFCKEFSSQEKFWLDMTSSFQIGYVFCHER